MTTPLTPSRLPSRRAVQLGLGVLVVLLVALFGYCAGSKHGRVVATVAQIHAHRDTVLDTIRVVEHRLVIDTQRVRVTTDVAQKKRVAFDSAAAAVEAAADTSATVPTNLAMPAVHACEAALVAQDTARAAVLVELADMTHDRDAQRQRAEDDERELKVLKPPRFGYVAGLLSGAGVVALLVHFLR